MFIRFFFYYFEEYFIISIDRYTVQVANLSFHNSLVLTKQEIEQEEKAIVNENTFLVLNS